MLHGRDGEGCRYAPPGGEGAVTDGVISRPPQDTRTPVPLVRHPARVTSTTSSHSGVGSPRCAFSPCRHVASGQTPARFVECVVSPRIQLRRSDGGVLGVFEPPCRQKGAVIQAEGWKECPPLAYKGGGWSRIHETEGPSFREILSMALPNDCWLGIRWEQEAPGICASDLDGEAVLPKAVLLDPVEPRRARAP